MIVKVKFVRGWYDEYIQEQRINQRQFKGFFQNIKSCVKMISIIQEREEVQQNECSDKIENENSICNDEPHYSADDEQQCEEFEDEVEPIYTPQQWSSLKKPCPIFQDEFILDEDPKKKVCFDESTTTEQSEDHPALGDLEMLAAMLLKENQKKFSYPKDLPVPTNVEQHLEELKMRFNPSQKQEDFISTYVKGDDLLRIKVGLCEEILNDQETQKFEDWVEQLCTSTNHESLKEMARKQKVKRYLEKKHSRTYEKKVHYHIRQKVAEERLRVKGRFVTWTQALKMLNEQQDSKKSWTYNDYFKIKNLLNEKFGAIKSERSLKF